MNQWSVGLWTPWQFVTTHLPNQKSQKITTGRWHLNWQHFQKVLVIFQCFIFKCFLNPDCNANKTESPKVTYQMFHDVTQRGVKSWYWWKGKVIRFSGNAQTPWGNSMEDASDVSFQGWLYTWPFKWRRPKRIAVLNDLPQKIVHCLDWEYNGACTLREANSSHLKTFLGVCLKKILRIIGTSRRRLYWTSRNLW